MKPRLDPRPLYRSAFLLLPGVVAMAILLLAAFSLALCAQQEELRSTHVDMLFSSSLFRSISRNDAMAALRLWGTMIGRRRGFRVETSVEVMDDVAAIRKRIQAQMPSVVGVDVVEYWKLADVKSLDPTFYAVMDTGTSLHYVALVRADSGITSLEGLRSKSAIIYAGTGANLGQIWLDSMLYDGRLGPAERFFSGTELVFKASSAILPVFFGRADVAIVEQSAFDLTKEMNPQIGARLRILYTSPKLIEGVACVNPRHEYRDALIESMKSLQNDTQGRQILTVFRFGHLLPIDRPALDEVHELWRKHSLLVKASEPGHVAALSRDKDTSPGDKR